ncbi:serglycin [Acanthochromis polyacanthus]|uniref:serglycin n=1 Tax=Acanthochromis polyacanthus TaxID=80966 RepID=UPI002234143F|nr:serglycin [Acanthochromis polyacanthus]
MKLVLLLFISCLALHNGKGAPSTAVYKFVKCNPEGGEANCVIQQTPKMAWSPDLPAKLPASAAQYLEAEPVEDDSPLMEDYAEVDEKEDQMIGQEGESPFVYPEEEGSGYEGSAVEDLYMADNASPAASETGSGDYWTEPEAELYKDGRIDAMRKLFPSRSLADEAKPAEKDLKEDHLLQL